MIYTIEEIRERIRPVAESYHLKAVYLFGSYARGEAKECSDVDLLVDTSGTPLKSLLSLGALYCELEEAFQKPIDLITVSSIEQLIRMPSEVDFRENIRRERVSLYVVA